MKYLYSLLVFALFEDGLFWAVKPQVTFASLSSPAVMDIRHLRRRMFEIISSYIKCESSVLKIQNTLSWPSHPPQHR